MNTELIANLRRLYVDNGTNYVQQAADELERQSNNAAILAQQAADLTAKRDALRAENEALRQLVLQSRTAIELAAYGTRPAPEVTAALAAVDAAMNGSTAEHGAWAGHRS